MHLTGPWKFLLVALTLVVIWFSLGAFYQIYQYIRLSAHVDPIKIQWSSKQITEELYHPEAQYEYVVNGVTYFGKTDFDTVAFRNSFAVEKSLPEYKMEKRVVWYDPRNIAHSTLQKHFPMKESISAILLIGLLIYFYGLAYYIDKIKDHR